MHYTYHAYMDYNLQLYDVHVIELSYFFMPGSFAKAVFALLLALTRNKALFVGRCTIDH